MKNLILPAALILVLIPASCATTGNEIVCGPRYVALDGNRYADLLVNDDADSKSLDDRKRLTTDEMAAIPDDLYSEHSDPRPISMAWDSTYDDLVASAEGKTITFRSDDVFAYPDEARIVFAHLLNPYVERYGLPLIGAVPDGLACTWPEYPMHASSLMGNTITLERIDDEGADKDAIRRAPHVPPIRP